jgi:hypothetical protein
VLELPVSECLRQGALHQWSGAGERCCHGGLGVVAPQVGRLKDETSGLLVSEGITSHLLVDEVITSQLLV